MLELVQWCFHDFWRALCTVAFLIFLSGLIEGIVRAARGL